MADLGPHSKGGEVLDRYVDLALGVFGAIRPTDEDRRALADHLGLEAARWINTRFAVGLPTGASPETQQNPGETMSIRTDNGDRIEILRPGCEGDVFIDIEFDGTNEVPSVMLRKPGEAIAELRLRPSQAERLIDELRLVLGPRSEVSR